ncbi:hypothetical protein KKA47_02790 [bacterium]|nr:hypothetical protein [bacterium]
MKSKIPVVLNLCAAAFFGLLSYPFLRTSAAPFFNKAYGSDKLSYAMIGSAVMALVAVNFYNWLSKRENVLSLCYKFFIFVALFSVVLANVIGKVKWVAFLYYAWSDVYIVILVEQFWSISNTIFNSEEAKKYYGVFLVVGSLASFVGNGLVTWLTPTLGATNMVYFNTISLGLFVISILFLLKIMSGRVDLKDAFKMEKELSSKSFFGGLTHLVRSRYLLIIGMIVLATQLYINGVYYLYNIFLDKQSSSVDIQTTLYGKTFLYIQVVTFILSMIGAPLTLKYLGVKKTHYSIIITIILLFGLALINPALIFIAILFVAAKSFDYSIFRSAKEMFYIPLSVAEKFQGKTFIDVFIYRAAKAIAAFIIIFVVNILNASAFYLVGFGIVLWLVMTILAVKKYEKLI